MAKLEKELSLFRKDQEALMQIKGQLNSDIDGFKSLNNDLNSKTTDLQKRMALKEEDLNKQKMEILNLRDKLATSSKEDEGIRSEFSILQEQLAREIENLNQYRKQKEDMSRQIEQLIEEKKAVAE
mmetsp:Transcript_8541/g.13187  ORF Transcript_8541/g.13187 Transcript_8541/m.13187 type:complete len:126 (+) Transcript_8541:937-1314(+)|eukprot:CAMPEP_0170511622 /NCGR_PEP_ID=MMETSP0208-20121228/66406_1 /TAXON_ID=197538 /ORGANISM="Strombidium inclinatum, Strain S3" /LENGTH=125 /DNA_ID=CAMNT_0010795181 /DNA_START=1678 /DNA_END=2055 /DNA_ORIENTATION=-